MPLALHYDRTVAIKRLADTTGDKEAYDDHLANVACHIQPLDDAFNEDMKGNFGKEWLMFCDVMDIKEGDQVIDDDAVIYKVASVESYNFLEQDRHMELRIRKTIA